MASTLFKVLTGFLLLLLIGSIIAFIAILNGSTCSTTKPPRYCQLCCGLDKHCNFKTRTLRVMAEHVYQYRLATEYKEVPQDKFISFFMMGNYPDISNLPKVEDMKDIALHQLATADGADFNRLLAYTPIFNHPKYVQCLKAYDLKHKTFKDVSTRSIIIDEVLGLSGDNLAKVIAKANDYWNSCYGPMEATDPTVCEVKDTTAMYDTTCLEAKPADISTCLIDTKKETTYDEACMNAQRRKSCLTQFKFTIDFNNMSEYIKSYLHDASDEAIYNLLQNGFTSDTLGRTLG